MFVNSDNYLLQLTLLAFSLFSAVAAAGIAAYYQKGGKPSIPLSGFVGFALSIVLLILVSFIKASRAIVDINLFDYVLSFFSANRFALLWLSLSMGIAALLGVLRGIFIGNKRAAITVGVIASFLTVSSGLFWFFIPNEPEHVVPGRILANSFNSIPVEFVLEEDRAYFDEAQYNRPIPLPLESDGDAQGETGSADTAVNPFILPEQAAAPTPTPAPTPPPDEPSVPETFAEYVSAYNEAKNIGYLKEAYTLYGQGAFNANSDKLLVADMWFGLGYESVEGVDKHDAFIKAAELYGELQEWYNAGASYYNAKDYDSAVANYRKAYRDANDFVGFRLRAVDMVADTLILQLGEGAQAAIDEYFAAIEHFADSDSKVGLYKKAADLILKSADVTDKLTAIVDLCDAALRIKELGGQNKRDLFFLLADTYYSHEMSEDVFATLDSALEQNEIQSDAGLTADVYEKMAGFHSDYGDKAEAIDSLTAANDLLGISDRSANIYIRIAQLYENDYDNARNAYLQAFSMEGIPYGTKCSAADGVQALAKEVYFSDVSRSIKYEFVIEVFTATFSFAQTEIALLYFQSVLSDNRYMGTESDWLSHYEGKAETESSKQYAYHPKMILYCAAVHIRRGEDKEAKELITKLNLIHKKQQSNFDNHDLVNYAKLLARYALYNEAITILGDLSPDGSDTYQLTAHRAIIEAASVYFAKTLSGKPVSKKEFQKHYESLSLSLVYFQGRRETNAIHSIEYLSILLGNQTGSDVDYTGLFEYIPEDQSINKYLRAFILYRVKDDLLAALEVCEEVLLDGTKYYDGFSSYDILLLHGEIAYKYASRLEGKEREDYLDRAIEDYSTVLQEISYLYDEAFRGLQDALEARGIQPVISPGREDMI